MLRGLFGKARFLDEEVEDWHLDTWRLLLEGLGPVRGEALVTPTREFFPPTEAKGHEKVEHVFMAVKAAMGMSQWVCRLEAQPTRSTGAQLSEFMVVQTQGVPLGTFRFEDGEAVITYAPELVDNPWQLTATLAHELSHYLLATIPDELDEETHELATDLTVAYAGLGLFGANTAFSFSQHGDTFSQGWQSSRSGYLSPRSWAFALAVFMALSESEADVERWLKPEMARVYRDAKTYLAKRGELLAGLKVASENPTA